MRNILFALTLLLSFYSYSQTPALQWQKCLGGTGIDVGHSVCPTTGGGYIIGGTTNSSDGDVSGYHGGGDLWVAKTAAFGVLQWQRSLGGPGYEDGGMVKPTPDGGYVVAGTTSSTSGDVTLNHGGSDAWVVKLSAAGAIEWQKTFGGTGTDEAKSVVVNSDGSFTIAGVTASNDGDATNNGFPGTFQAWLFGVSSTGTLLWQKSYGGSGADGALAVDATADGGYVLAGYTQSFNGNVTGNHGSRDMWVVKTNGTGVLQWQLALGGSNYDEARGVAVAADGSLYVGGFSNSADGDVSGVHGSNHDYFIAKLNTSGTAVWKKVYGGTNADQVWGLSATTNGCVLNGYSSSTDGDVVGNHAGTGDYWVVELTTAGTIRWQRSLGTTSYDEGWNVVQDTDGGFTAIGQVTGNNSDVTGFHGGGSGDVWIAKLAPLSAPADLGITAPSLTSTTVTTATAFNLNFTETNSGGSDAGAHKIAFYLSADTALTPNANGDLYLGQYPVAAGVNANSTSGVLTQSLVVPCSVAAGTYYLLVRADAGDEIAESNEANNLSSLQVTVVAGSSSVPATPVITASPGATVCQGTPVSLTAGSAGCNGCTYSWTNGGTGASVSVSGGGTYAVTATNSCGTSTAQQVVTVTPTPAVTLTPSATTTCQGTSITLTASGASAYSWSGTGLSATTGGTVVASAAAAGTYNYTVTGTANGCPASQSVSVTVKPSPVVVTNNDTALCAGTSVTLAASGAATYTWGPSAGLNTTTGATVVVQPTNTTTYLVTGTLNGCTASDFVLVTVLAPPVVTVSPGDTSVCAGASFGLSAAGAAGYAWSPSTGLSSATGASVTGTLQATTTYTVRGTAANGCTAVASRTITVIPVVVPAIAVSYSGCPSATLTFTGSVTNGGSNPQVRWYVNNQPAGTGATYVLNNATNGAQVYAQLTSTATCAAPATVSAPVSTINCVVTALPEVEGLTGSMVAPNPVRDRLRVHLAFTGAREVQCRLFAVSGQAVLQTPTLRVLGSYDTVLHLSRMPQGVYQLQVRIGDQVLLRRVVVQR